MILRRLWLAALAATILAAPAPGRSAEAGLHAERRPVADYTFHDAGRGLRSLSEFRGKVLLVNFWASWCLPCRVEFPALDRVQRRFGGPDFEVLAISLDRLGLPAVRLFLEQVGARNLSGYADPNREAVERLGIRTLPTSLLLDRQGREAARIEAAIDWEAPELQALIAILMGESTGE